MKFPRIVAAVKNRERSAWDLADAIVVEVPQGDGDTMRAAQDAIQASSGVIYSPGTLAKYRRVAEAFPPGRRPYRLSFTHYEVLATVPPSDRETLARRAEAQSWTTDDLRIATGRAATEPRTGHYTPDQVRDIVAAQPDVVADEVARNIAANTAFTRKQFEREEKRKAASQAALAARQSRLDKTHGSKDAAFFSVDLATLGAQADTLAKLAKRVRATMTGEFMEQLTEEQRAAFITEAQEIGSTIDDALGDLRTGIIEARHKTYIDTRSL